MGKIFNYSVASVSWIDAATGLPEIDRVSYTYDGVTRSNLTANFGYRFCNFMDVFIELSDDGRIIRSGFHPESAIYRGPSYAHIPSHAFETKQYMLDGGKSKLFVQVIGARTVSPEVIGESGGAGVGAGTGAAAGLWFFGPFGAVIGGVVGGVSGYYTGKAALHTFMGFPPIWSRLEIELFDSGIAKPRLVQHSIFPSLTWYAQTDTSLIRGQNYRRVGSYYNATKDVELPKWKLHGWGAIQGEEGPSMGNPWGMQKGLTGGDASEP